MRKKGPGIGIILIVLFMGATGYIAGTNHAHLLTCEDFEISGNYAPADCSRKSVPRQPVAHRPSDHVDHREGVNLDAVLIIDKLAWMLGAELFDVDLVGNILCPACREYVLFALNMPLCCLPDVLRKRRNT